MYEKVVLGFPRASFLFFVSLVVFVSTGQKFVIFVNLCDEIVGDWWSGIFGFPFN